MKIKNLIILASFLWLSGCAIPGTYMAGHNVRSYTDPNFKGRLLRTHIIPIDEAMPRGGRFISLKPYDYRIGAFDVLTILVWNHPELSAPVSTVTSVVAGGGSNIAAAPINQINQEQTGLVVNSHGMVYFPYAGNVKVGGLTVNDARNLLARKLSVYIRNPQISIKVASYQSSQAHIIGEVLRTGPINLTDKPLTLLDGIEAAGGINNTTADAGQIYVIRGDLQDFAVYWLNGTSARAMIMAEHFYLMPNDIIYVAPAGLVNWNRVVSQILPTVTTVWYTKATVAT